LFFATPTHELFARHLASGARPYVLNDFAVLDDGNPVGCIRHAAEGASAFIDEMRINAAAARARPG